MSFRVQCLDASSSILAEWCAVVLSDGAEIALLKIMKLPTGSARFRIVDEGGGTVHEQAMNV